MMTRTEARAVDQLLAEFEQLRPEGGWTCDGGAVVLSDMLSRKKISHRLRIGLFAPSTDDEEHHHWIEIGPFEEEVLLIDPNAELRNQPRSQQITTAVRELYNPRDDIGSRSDREIMQFSPLWDWDDQELIEVWELEDDHDPGVDAYLSLLSQRSDDE